jgi:phosphatidylglycerophosphate synthase
MGDAPAPDRRPIAARELRVFQRMAAWLAARGVSANAISVAGMACGILAGAAFAISGHVPSWRLHFALGAGLVALRLLANMLDGMVAIAAGRTSRVGELYNEVPDRVSDVATLIGLGLARGGHLGWGFAAALAAVMTAYVRAAAKVAGAPQDYGGPMAKQQRMALVIAAALACAVLPAEWSFDRKGRGLAAACLFLVTVGSVITSSRRLARAARSLD